MPTWWTRSDDVSRCVWSVDEFHATDWLFTAVNQLDVVQFNGVSTVRNATVDAAFVKGGLATGATDPHGYEAVENKCHIHDWHATILHLLGLDHERLTYRYAGRDFRLTDVYGNVVNEIVA